MEVECKIGQHTSETIIHRADIRTVCEAMITEMQRKLPKEVHTMAVFEYTLKECRKIFKRSPIKTINSIQK